MKKKPLITVVTVVFNAVHTLEQTIKSVSSQSFNNYEYIIIDGKSTDGTIELIERYKENIDFFISETDSGIYDAMNKGISHANGDWIFFLGADDVLMDADVLQKVSLYLKEDNIYYGNVQFKSNKKIYNGYYNQLKICLSNISHQAIFYPKSVYEKIGFDVTYCIYADYIYNLNLFAENPKKFKYIPIIITFFNDFGASSVTKDFKFDKDFNLLIRRKFGMTLFLFTFFIRKISKIKKNIF